MSKPPTRARGRRALEAPPPPPPPRRRAKARAVWPAALSERRLTDAAVTRLSALGWRPLAVLVVCLAGLADSIYLTLTHYSDAVPLVCSATGEIDCAKVTASPESMVFGIPVALYGLVFFVVMVALALPAVWRRPEPAIPLVRLAASVVGLGFVAYLLYAELYVIHAICVWCTVVHGLTFVLFVLLVTGLDDARARAGAT